MNCGIALFDFSAQWKQIATADYIPVYPYYKILVLTKILKSMLSIQAKSMTKIIKQLKLHARSRVYVISYKRADKCISITDA